MDCVTARQLIDSDPGLPRAAESVSAQDVSSLTQAQQHVHECDQCQAVVESRRRFDVSVGEVCRGVPVPVGLKERLLAAVAANQSAALQNAHVHVPAAMKSDSDDVPSLVQADAHQSMHRATERSRSRRWTLIVSSAGLLLIAVSLALFWRPPTPTVPFEAAVDAVTASVLAADQRPPFTGFASPIALQLPRSGRVASVIDSEPRLVVVKGQPFACYFFSVKNRRKNLVAGRLLVLPRSAVQNPSAISNALPTLGAWSVAAWTEGDLAYVLTVAGHDELQRLVPDIVTF